MFQTCINCFLVKMTRSPQTCHSHDPGQVLFRLPCIPKECTSLCLVQGTPTLLLTFSKRQGMIAAAIKAIYSIDNILYIKIVFYLFYKHDVLFLIFNLNPFCVLAGKAINVCEICWVWFRMNGHHDKCNDLVWTICWFSVSYVKWIFF